MRDVIASPGAKTSVVESQAAKNPAAPAPVIASDQQRPLQMAPPSAKPPAAVEQAIKTSWYWVTLVLSLASLIIVWLYYSTRLYFWLQIIYWITAGLALGLFVWSLVGVLNRYNVLTRMTARAERLREMEDASGDENIVYRENIVVRLFKGVGHLITLLFLFVWNTFLRLLYIAELIVLQSIILAYDLIYYLSYAAWTIAFYAIRLALRITRWALRTSWKILRILTYLPLAKSLWRKKMMPSIMGKWNARMEERRQRMATRREQKRRLVAAKGHDPDKWEADAKARHHFFLPHPHDARRGLRERIDDRQKQDFNRRDRWTAYRKGQPIPPKYHSERKKLILEEKKRRKQEKKQKERGARPDPSESRRPERRGSRPEPRAADEK